LKCKKSTNRVEIFVIMSSQTASSEQSVEEPSAVVEGGEPAASSALEEQQQQKQLAREEMGEEESESLDIISSIQELQGESESIKDILEMEKAYAQEVASVMKQFLEQIGKSYVLEPSLFPRLGHSVKEVILTPQGVFFLSYSNGLNVARTVDDLSPESLIKVLEHILPDVKAFLAERRQKLSARATMLEKVAGELKRIPNLPKSARSQASRPQ
jgi:hypothetical protein